MTPEDVRELFETVTTPDRPDRVDVEAAARRGRGRLRRRAVAAGLGAATAVAAVALVVVPLVTGSGTSAGPADPAATTTAAWVDTPAPAGCLPFELSRPGAAPWDDPEVGRLHERQDPEVEKLAMFGERHQDGYVSLARDTDLRSPCLHVWWYGTPPPQLQELIGTLTSKVWVHRARWTRAELQAGVSAVMGVGRDHPQEFGGQYVCAAGLQPEAVSVSVCGKGGAVPSAVDPDLAAAVRKLTDVDVVLAPSAPVSLK